MFNLADKRFVKFKHIYGENRANKALPGTCKIWEIYIGYAQLPLMSFLINSVSKHDSFVPERELKKHKLFITVLTNIHLVKPAWPAEPILLTPKLLVEGPCGRRRQSQLVMI